MDKSLLPSSDLYPHHNDTHIAACWRLSHCAACISSSHGCGWCPISGICVPMHRSSNLLSPVSDAHICPLPWQERWELRTRVLGCNCSTATFLAAIGTCFGTLFALLSLWLLVKIINGIRSIVKASRSGVTLVMCDDGSIREEEWVRKRRLADWWQSLISKWRRKDGEIRLEEEEGLVD